VNQVRHKHWYTRFRDRLRSKPGVDLTYRSLIGVIGALVLVIGIIAIPYPGPGWLIVFAGLAILGTEFHWAQRLLHAVRRRYNAWTHWLNSRSPGVRLVVMATTGVVVLLTLWLVNAFGLVAGMVGIDSQWLSSPML
jgi:uncharacterized protein (TIGR02611 family)